MADWSLPALTSTYTNFATEVKNRDVDLALQFDGTTSTSIPTGAIRWTSSANTWQRWTGSAWGALSSTFAFPAITTTGSVGVGTSSATSPLTIQASNTSYSGAINIKASAGGTTGAITQAAGNLFLSSNASSDHLVINSSGQVGIGNTSPGSALDVSGNIRLSAALPNIEFNNGGAMVYGPASNTLAFATGGGPGSPSERLRLDSSGRLLVGTSTSRTGLATFASGANNTNADYQGSAGSFVGPGLVGTATNSATVSVEDNRNMAIDVGGSIGFGGRYLTGDSSYAQWAAISGKKSTGTSGEYGGYLGFYTRTHAATTIDERVRITSTGLVGIATASPAVTLDVNAVDAVRIAAGTTAQRPTGAAGMIRYNSSLAQFEGYGTAWGTIGGGAKGAGSDQVFFENDQAITTNYTITTNKNAMTAGPVTVNSGITVTIPSGSSWSIV